MASAGALLFGERGAQRINVVHDVVGIVLFARSAFRSAREVVETGDEKAFLDGEAFQKIVDGLCVGIVVARLGIAAKIGVVAAVLRKCVEQTEIVSQFVGQSLPDAIWIDIAPFLVLVDKPVVQAYSPRV